MTILLPMSLPEQPQPKRRRSTWTRIEPGQVWKMWGPWSVNREIVAAADERVVYRFVGETETHECSRATFLRRARRRVG